MVKNKDNKKPRKRKLSSKDLKEARVELARSGGNATFQKYGQSHYSAMGRKRWDNEKKKKEQTNNAS